MKAIVISMVAAGFLVAGNAMAADIPTAVVMPAAIVTAPVAAKPVEPKELGYVEMPVTAQKNNCTACHAIYRRLVGPAWLEVSKKYKGQTKFTYASKEYPLLEGLMLKVSKGGAGSWGAMPMPANDAAGAKQADIKDLVTFVIGLENADNDKKVAKKKFDEEKARTKKSK
jgi:cytochrome c